jgi:hypothetical protein
VYGYHCYTEHGKLCIKVNWSYVYPVVMSTTNLSTHPRWRWYATDYSSFTRC